VKITAEKVLAYYNRTEFQFGKESLTKWLQEELGPRCFPEWTYSSTNTCLWL